MGRFADNVWFEVVHCCSCGMAFAMPSDFNSRRLGDHGKFYCPAGHGQHYSGKTEEQKLREQLAQSSAKVADLNGRVNSLRHERDSISKAHRKMRVRVLNGVCPCCNRSFDNLRQHMQTKHADFGKEQTLRALRTAFGMTQADLADEANVLPAYVSMYECGKRVPRDSLARLNWWVESQNVAA